MVNIFLVSVLGLTPEAVALTDTASQPTNLLVTLLEYSSIVMQDIKG